MTYKPNKSYRTNQTHTIYLPIALSIVLIVAAGVVVLRSLKRPERQVVPGPINLNAPVIKHPDIVDTVQLDADGGGKDRVQVRFSWEVDGIKYNDALNFSPEEYAKLTPKRIEQLKDERFRNWANLVNTQSQANE